MLSQFLSGDGHFHYHRLRDSESGNDHSGSKAFLLQWCTKGESMTSQEYSPACLTR